MRSGHLWGNTTRVSYRLIYIGGAWGIRAEIGIYGLTGPGLYGPNCLQRCRFRSSSIYLMWPGDSSVRVYTYIGHQYLAATFSTSVLELVSAHSLYSMIRDDLKLLDDGGEIPKS